MTIIEPVIRPYVGNGPYCYTNSLVTVLGADAPTPAVVETLTGSSFGFQLLAGALPLFDPYGWNPDLGLTQALKLLGYTCRRETFQDAVEALTILRRRLAEGQPVLVGPVDMGLLAHQPDSDRATGADHFVVALEVTERDIVFHDPQGHPWAALPQEVFSTAWRAKEIGYADGAYAMRSRFERTERIRTDDALVSSLTVAREWLTGRDLPVPPDTLGGRPAIERLAQLVKTGSQDGLAELLSRFSIPVGARRRADAAACFADVGATAVAEALHRQAREIGRLQYPAVRRDTQALARGLRRLGELHEELADAVAHAVSSR
jgi:hypothetical protein